MPKKNISGAAPAAHRTLHNPRSIEGIITLFVWAEHDTLALVRATLGARRSRKLPPSWIERQVTHHRSTEDVLKTLDAKRAKAAKVIVDLAFRNGPIQAVHAVKVCSVCCGSVNYSRNTEDDMKGMIKPD